ncbi:MAG: transposase [Chloroflexota bacterium]
MGAAHARDDWPRISTLVCDDAAAFRLVTDDLALCWIHEGRHYKKLVAHLDIHRRLLDTVRTEFWTYYRELRAYQEQPTDQERDRLTGRFEAVFGQVTGYRLLDERLARTREKQTSLLRVLEHPELPLHNNPAELAARRRVRKRDASFGPRSLAGLRAWDTFHTLAATTQQLGVSFLAYLVDRWTHAGQIPPLAEILTARAATLHLGDSWSPA